MTFAGETLANGAPGTCVKCGVDAFSRLAVHDNPAGYFIGAYCECGPYSRESIFFPDWDIADAIAEAARLAISVASSETRSAVLAAVLRHHAAIRP